MALEDELSDASNRATKFARRNYGASYLTAGLSVLTSIAASICVSVDGVPKWTTALLAAIPAVLMAVRTTFMFESKAAWHWRKATRVDSLMRALKYENQSPAEISHKFSQIEEEMEEKWVYFGHPHNPEKLEAERTKQIGSGS